MAHKVLKNQIFLKKIYMPAFFLVCCLVCCLMTTTIAWSSPWQLSNQLLHLKRLSITQEKTKHEGKTKHNFRPLHTTHETAKISMKKVAVKIVAYIKTVDKNRCSCEKKLQCVWKITAFFAVLCVVCEGLYGTGVYILVKNKTEFEVLRTLHTTMTFTNIFLKKSLRK